ncbi:hypothetical protein CFN78_13260 [Amycolatopsis antarctica]|uniref:DUF2020 domain-containing protein n=1 Tax=Amycolatopsis antarctica TaxID=1854586 RepID=A0A263D4S1_9PSEU|nr:DUF2020 domain-containing protein [Amycolatopsis antarctica]OZM72607.1 hypothetical protein CFN78_13260 [Amycolatopsis antarctica]
MRRVLLTIAAATLLAGCSQPQPAEPQGSTPAPEPSTSAAPELPPEPEPTASGPCPYLDEAFVADANGQMVSKVQTSADTPHPACFFYTLGGKLQLTVRVYSGDPAVATALVDQAAPVDTSNPANEPAGWKGGYQAVESGSVYAVAKEGNAVLVTGNQEQSIKARTVATQAIAGLGF